MPLSEDALLQPACLGVAAESFENLDQVQDQIEIFLSEVLPECRRHLKGFSDGTITKRNEKDLASSLCRWLGAYACEREVVFTFANEEPDKSRKSRTNDMAVIPSVGVARLKVGPQFFDPDDHLYIIEAKLLPTPKARAGEGDRSREYVVGNWAGRESPGKSSTGGMERFKEGWHGRGFLRSAMIAFIMAGTATAWHADVNVWIDDLIANPISSHKAAWAADDRLISVDGVSDTSGVSEFTSRNSRSGDNSPITLRHFWISCCS